MFLDSFLKLKTYCENEKFKGWDPYDGLNSKIFRATPLKNWRFGRLAWIQLFKRNPINLRKLLLVPKGYNSKGVGLFLYGYSRLYALAKQGDTRFGSEAELLNYIKHLGDLVIELRSEGFQGSCWGYNFDWQNRVFFQPANTPTVVATSFVTNALFEAYEVTKEQKYLDVALDAANFILKDLNRTEFDDSFIFSYSPLDNSKVYNASLLGARLLARCYFYNKNETYKNLAQKAVKAIIDRQSADGSWIYGEAEVQDWIDNFHTGFNLECIHDYMKYTGDTQYKEAYEKGFDYYLKNFFLEDGTPKYYHDKLYPIDIHSPAQLMTTLSISGKLGENKALADKVLRWGIENMQHRKGYFYYQLKPTISSKIPYIRWAQAWMFYGFSNYFYFTSNENLD